MQRRTSMGLTPDSFQSIRFATPQRLLGADRLMTLAAEVGAAGAHGGMPDISFEWARRTRRMKDELDMYLEIQTFLPRDDPGEFEHAVKVAKEAGATSLRAVCLLGRRYELMATPRRLEAGGRRLPCPDRGRHPDRRAAPDAARHRESQGLARRSAGRAARALRQRIPRRVPRHRQQPGGAGRSDRDDREAGAAGPSTSTSRTWRWRNATNGFLLSEVPLGEGILDLPRIVDIIRRRKAGRALLARNDRARSAGRPLPHRPLLGELRGGERARAGTRARAHPRQPEQTSRCHGSPASIRISGWRWSTSSSIDRFATRGTASGWCDGGA